MRGRHARFGRLLAGAVVLLASVVVAPVLAAGPASAAANEWIQMDSVNPNDPTWVVDVANWGTANRSPVHVWELLISSTDANQRWTPVFSSLNGTTYTIALRNNGANNKCLDKSMDHGNANNAAVYIYDCSYAANQLWRYNPNPRGYSDLRNVADPGRCLTAWGNYEGATLDVEDCGGYVQQSWHIANFSF